LTDSQNAVRQAHIEVRRTARYALLGEYEGARDVRFVLHGYAQLAGRFLRKFNTLAQPGRLLIAPEALNRYYFETAPGVHAADAGVGATWMTREDRDAEMDDYTAYLDTLYAHTLQQIGGRPERIVALGFSQGAAAVARWIARDNAAVTDLVLCGGFLPDDVSPSTPALRGVTVTFVHGTQDRYATAARVGEAADSLQAAGVDARMIAFDGGHHIDAAALRTISAKV
jgi:predicted esterase